MLGFDRLVFGRFLALPNGALRPCTGASVVVVVVVVVVLVVEVAVAVNLCN